MKKRTGKPVHATGLVTGVLALITCLPCLLAPLLISLGMSSVIVFVGNWFTPVLFVLVGASLIGLIWSLRTHKNPVPFLIALVAGGLLIYGQPAVERPAWSIAGGVVLMIAVTTDWWLRRKHSKACDDCEADTTPKVKG